MKSIPSENAELWIKIHQSNLPKNEVVTQIHFSAETAKHCLYTLL